jgi:multiple sugar transport system permease protein
VSQDILFTIATFAFWLGLGAALRAVFLGCRASTIENADLKAKTMNGLLKAVVVANLSLIGYLILPKEVGREIPGEGLMIPMVWFYSHFWGWMVVFGIIYLITNIIQSYLGITQEEKTKRVQMAAISGVIAIVGYLLFKQFGSVAFIFRGAFNAPVINFVVTLLVIAAIVAYSGLTARKKTMRNRNKTLGIHVVLLIGCVIFGLPFAWLMSSSLKEDKDVTGQVTWIPRRTEKVAFSDPDSLQYRGEYAGKSVLAAKIKDVEDGKWQMDVIEPISIRGRTFEVDPKTLKEEPKLIPIVFQKSDPKVRGFVMKVQEDGNSKFQILEPADQKGQIKLVPKDDLEESRPAGANWNNYPAALEYLPQETSYGLVYLKNTVILVVLGVIGTVLSCAVVSYAFSRLSFPGKETLFKVLLSTMMLPGAVTMLPQFLIFTRLGWIDTLLPLWVPTFFAGAFNVFMMRQFFDQIPIELEDAAKIDGCTYLTTFWQVMMPQVKPALAVVAIWTFMGTWNNFMGPLIYINSPEKMPIAYALQLFSGERGGEPALLMAFAALTMLPVLAIFFFAQKYFIEGVSMSGLGGR